MIVQPHGNGLRVFRQVDHAAFAGALAAHLKHVPEPRDAFIAAVRLHDNGWREADEEPLLNADTGAPHTYRDTPREPYRAIWTRGIERAVAVDPYVGLLVSLHGTQFFARKHDPPDRMWYEAEREREDALLATLGLGGDWRRLPPAVRAHYEWLGFLDGLSLYVCDQWEGPWRIDVEELGLLEVTGANDRYVIDPWPFDAPALSFNVPYRTLPRNRYEDEETLRGDYRNARVEMLEGHLHSPRVAAALEPNEERAPST